LRYPVQEPLLAVYNEPGMETAFVTIEPGSVITVRDKHEFGFVDVSYPGQIVQVFMRDVERRADRVEGQTG
jgi:hypothetical protein